MNMLITESLKRKSVTALLSFPRALLDKQESQWIAFINDYMVKYGEPPSLGRFESEHAFFITRSSSSPLDDIFDTTLKRKRNAFFVSAVIEHEKDINGGADPKPIVDALHSTFSAGGSGTAVSTTFDRTQYFDSKRRYSFGIQTIDESVGGLNDGDYVLIVGRPGSHKTTFMEWLMSSWLLDDMRILYVSNENPMIEAMQKIDSFIGGWNPLRMRDGAWTKEDRERVRAVDWFMSQLDGGIIIPSEPLLTPSQVASFASSNHVDAIFIDGIYIMTNDLGVRGSGWENAAAVSRALKRYSRSANVPIVGTIQAGRGAEGTLVERDTIAHTDAFLQDADTIISLNRINEKTIGRIVKSRWGPTLLAKTFELVIDFDAMTIGCLDEIELEIIEEEEW